MTLIEILDMAENIRKGITCQNYCQCDLERQAINVKYALIPTETPCSTVIIVEYLVCQKCWNYISTPDRGMIEYSVVSGFSMMEKFSVKKIGSHLALVHVSTCSVATNDSAMKEPIEEIAYERAEDLIAYPAVTACGKILLEEDSGEGCKKCRRIVGSIFARYLTSSQR